MIIAHLLLIGCYNCCRVQRSVQSPQVLIVPGLASAPSIDPVDILIDVNVAANKDKLWHTCFVGIRAGRVSNILINRNCTGSNNRGRLCKATHIGTRKNT